MITQILLIIYGINLGLIDAGLIALLFISLYFNKVHKDLEELTDLERDNEDVL